MIRNILTVWTFLSAVFFPWPMTFLLALISARYEPLVPLAAGIFMDILYYSPLTQSIPVFTLGGAVITAVAYLLLNRLRMR